MEMLDVQLPDNVQVVIETGGASMWQNEMISADYIQRYLYNSDDLYLVDEQPLADMGDPATLADFLSFCEENYPADHTAVIFWNHGGGSVAGVSFDELYDAFKTYMKVSTSVSSLGLMEDDSEDAAVNITKNQQMYCRVKVKNSDQAFEYVPVYVFSGYASQGDYKEDGWVNHFCVVNATDGTIINTWLGY